MFVCTNNIGVQKMMFCICCIR